MIGLTKQAVHFIDCISKHLEFRWDPNSVQQKSSIYHIEGKSDFAESSGSSDAMQICLAVSIAISVDRKVEIKDNSNLSTKRFKLK